MKTFSTSASRVFRRRLKAFFHFCAKKPHKEVAHLNQSHFSLARLFPSNKKQVRYVTGKPMSVSQTLLRQSAVSSS